MSRGIEDLILVGESGDVLIEYSDFGALKYSDLGYERVDDTYVRLLGIPVIRQAFEWFEMILMLTEDGRLFLIDKDHPQGQYIELDLPPLKRIYNLDPIFVLDVGNTLYPLDLPWILHEQFNGEVDVLEYYRSIAELDEDDNLIVSIEPIEMKITSIENVKEVSYAEDIISSTYPYKNWMYILTYDNYLIRGVSTHLIHRPSERYKIGYDIQRMIGRLMLTDSDKILIYDEGMRDIPEIIYTIEVNYPVEDMILMDDVLYTIDSDGVIRRYGKKVTIVRTDFRAIRFLVHKDRPVIEDDGGNNYGLKKFKIISFPIRLMNLDIIGIEVEWLRKLSKLHNCYTLGECILFYWDFHIQNFRLSNLLPAIDN